MTGLVLGGGSAPIDGGLAVGASNGTPEGFAPVAGGNGSTAVGTAAVAQLPNSTALGYGTKENSRTAFAALLSLGVPNPNSAGGPPTSLFYAKQAGIVALAGQSVGTDPVQLFAPATVDWAPSKSIPVLFSSTVILTDIRLIGMKGLAGGASVVLQSAACFVNQGSLPVELPGTSVQQTFGHVAGLEIKASNNMAAPCIEVWVTPPDDGVWDWAFFANLSENEIPNA